MAKKQTQSYNLFQCDCCKDLDEMEFKDFKNHLIEVHGIGDGEIKGKKQMIMHMDGAEWFSSTYKWTLENGTTFHQFTQNARAKNDPMRF